LISAIEIAGVPDSATVVPREYNSRSNQPPISSHAVRKWLMGEAIPTQDRIQVLANWLNVSPSWLRFGEELGDTKIKDLTAREWRLVQGFRRLTDKQKAGLLTMVLSIPAAGSKKSTRDA
jgi:transcriptional regulator with XRE-family HTH domain